MKKADLILILLSGLLIGFSFNFLNLGLLAWFGFVPFLFAIKNKSYITTGIYSLILGAIIGIISLYWISAFHIIALVFFIIYFGVFYSAFFLYYKFITKRILIYYAFVPAAFFVFLEFLRTLTQAAFPWNMICYTQVKYIYLTQIASVTGMLGVSFLVIWCNFIIFNLLSTLLKKNKLIIEAVVFMIFTGTVIAASINIIPKEAMIPTQIKIALIQTNIDPNIDYNKERGNLLKRYYELTARAVKQNPDLIIWPENAIRDAVFSYSHLTGNLLWDDFAIKSQLREMLIKGKSHLLIGTVTKRSEKNFNKYYNAGVLLSPEANIEGVYEKIHLVPFGEYLPFFSESKVVKSIARKLDISDFSFPEEAKLIKFKKGNFGALICYEDCIPDITEKLIDKGAKFLVNITNDGWAMSKASQTQHFAASVYRSIENRSFLVRSANTGKTCFIDIYGRVYKELPDFTTDILTGYVDVRSSSTFYSTAGNVFVYICLLISLFFILISSFVKRVKIYR